MKHKWAKEIKAWADGAEIEVWDIRVNAWVETTCPSWITDPNVNIEYRIKPQQQQSSCCKCQQTCSALKEPQYLYLYIDSKGWLGIKNTDSFGNDLKCIGKIKLEDEASSSGED